MPSINDLPPPGASLVSPRGIDDLPPPATADQDSGIGQSLLRGAARVGQAIDSYTGAPTRAAVYAAETSPTELGRPMAGIRAFANQFEQAPSTAPSGLDIVNAGGYLPKNS